MVKRVEKIIKKVGFVKMKLLDLELPREFKRTVIKRKNKNETYTIVTNFYKRRWIVFINKNSKLIYTGHNLGVFNKIVSKFKDELYFIESF